MDDIIDISTINLNENLSNDWNSGSSRTKTTNFGPGIELLMNDKKKENSGRQSDIELDDLNNLEDELNNLTDDADTTRFESRSDLFNRNISFDDKPSVHFDDNSRASLGQATAEFDNDSKTWDGYSNSVMFPLIPINLDKANPKCPKKNC